MSLVHRDLLALPFKDHPIFTLRKYTIMAALAGLILCAASLSGYYGADNPVGFAVFLFLISLLVCLCDLISYARKQRKTARDPESKPEWPITEFIFMDLLLALALFVICWGVLAFSMEPWHGNSPSQVLQAYGALAVLVCSILHGKAFWRQVMARKKHAWLASLPKDTCARCGYTDIEDDSPSCARPHSDPTHDDLSKGEPNVHPYAGRSADFGQANILTPEQSESVMEEGLLIGSDFGGGYQTMARDDETTIEQPEGAVVVKTKGKGKKKAGPGGESDF